MYDNHDEVLSQLSGAGLEPDGLEVGRLIRCRTAEDRGRQRSGWYSLHELRTDSGARLLVGAYGNFREGVDPTSGRALSHRIELRRQKLSPEERAAIRQRVAEEKRRAERKKEQDQEKAARVAQRAWARLSEEGSSAYLARKGVHGQELRQDRTGTHQRAFHSPSTADYPL